MFSEETGTASNTVPGLFIALSPIRTSWSIFTYNKLFRFSVLILELRNAMQTEAFISHIKTTTAAVEMTHRRFIVMVNYVYYPYLLSDLIYGEYRTRENF
jgi:hypothetical protein